MDRHELKRLRKSTGLSQEKFATMVKVSNSAIAKCEQGKTHLNTNNAERVRAAVKEFKPPASASFDVVLNDLDQQLRDEADAATRGETARGRKRLRRRGTALSRQGAK
jgi:transcriptional regulator with XRE-family HTH domain